MKEYFVGICPYCGSEVLGWWDWETGSICIQGFCKKCKIFLLEDEVDWSKKGEKVLCR
jgi:hypothetical protein